MRLKDKLETFGRGKLITEKKGAEALAGWLSWMEHCPMLHRTVGSIPGVEDI